MCSKNEIPSFPFITQSTSFRFMREMAEKEYEKDQTIALAQRILQKAHPDGASVIKHWITIIQSRWDEVSTWAKQVS